MNQKHVHLLAVTIVLILTFIPSAAAQQSMQFKVGDRVEIDVIMAGAPERSMYKKGTVVAVDGSRHEIAVTVIAKP